MSAVQQTSTPTDPMNILVSPFLYIDDGTFFGWIQDSGQSYKISKKPKKSWAPDNSPDKVCYPLIYECGVAVFNNISGMPSLFPKLARRCGKNDL